MATGDKTKVLKDVFGLYAAGPGASGIEGTTYVYGGTTTTVPVYGPPTTFTPPLTIDTGPTLKKAPTFQERQIEAAERIATALEAIVERFC